MYSLMIGFVVACALVGWRRGDWGHKAGAIANVLLSGLAVTLMVWAMW